MQIRQGDKPNRNVFYTGSNLIGQHIEKDGQPMFRNLVRTDLPFNPSNEQNILYGGKDIASTLIAQNVSVLSFSLSNAGSVLFARPSAKNQLLSWKTAAGDCNSPLVGFSKYDRPQEEIANSKYMQFYMYVNNGNVYYCQNGQDAVNICDQIEGRNTLDTTVSHTFSIRLYEDTVSYYVDSALWAQARVPAQGCYHAWVCTPNIDSINFLIYPGLGRLIDYQHLIYGPFPLVPFARDSMVGALTSNGVPIPYEFNDGTFLSSLLYNGNTLSIDRRHYIGQSAYYGVSLRYGDMKVARDWKYASYSFTYKKLPYKLHNSCGEFQVLPVKLIGSFTSTSTSSSTSRYQLRIYRTRDGVRTSLTTNCYHYRSDHTINNVAIYTHTATVNLESLFGDIKAYDTFEIQLVSTGIISAFSLTFNYANITERVTNLVNSSVGRTLFAFQVLPSMRDVTPAVCGLICQDSNYLDESDSEKSRLYLTTTPIMFVQPEYYTVYVVNWNSVSVEGLSNPIIYPTSFRVGQERGTSNTMCVQRGIDYDQLNTEIPSIDAQNMYNDARDAYEEVEGYIDMLESGDYSRWNEMDGVNEYYVEYNNAHTSRLEIQEDCDAAYSDYQYYSGLADGRYQDYQDYMDDRNYYVQQVNNQRDDVAGIYTTFTNYVERFANGEITFNTFNSRINTTINSLHNYQDDLSPVPSSVSSAYSSARNAYNDFSDTSININDRFYNVQVGVGNYYVAIMNALITDNNPNYANYIEAENNANAAFEDANNYATQANSALATYNGLVDDYNDAVNREEQALQNYNSALGDAISNDLSGAMVDIVAFQSAIESYNTAQRWNHYTKFVEYSVSSTKINICNEDVVNVKFLPITTLNTDSTESKTVRVVVDVNGENVYSRNVDVYYAPRMYFKCWEGTVFSDLLYQPLFDSVHEANVEQQMNLFDNYTRGSDSPYLQEPYENYAQTYDGLTRIGNNTHSSLTTYDRNFFEKIVTRKTYKNGLMTFWVTSLNSTEYSQQSIIFRPSFFTEQHPLGSIELCQNVEKPELDDMTVIYAIGMDTDTGGLVLARANYNNGTLGTTTISAVEERDRVDILFLKGVSSTASNRLSYTFYVFVNGILLDTYTLRGLTYQANGLVYGVNIRYPGDYFLGLRIKELSNSNTDTAWDTKPWSPSSSVVSKTTYSYNTSSEFVCDGVYKNSLGTSASGGTLNGWNLGALFTNTTPMIIKQFCKADEDGCADIGFSYSKLGSISTNMFRRTQNYLISSDIGGIAVHELDSRVTRFDNQSIIDGVVNNDTAEIIRPKGLEPFEYYALGYKGVGQNTNNLDIAVDNADTSNTPMRIEPLIQNYYPGKENGKTEIGYPTVVATTNERVDLELGGIAVATVNGNPVILGTGITVIDCGSYYKYKKIENSEAWTGKAVVYGVYRDKVDTVEFSCKYTTNATSRAMLGLLYSYDATISGGFTDYSDFEYSIYTPSGESSYYAENRDMSDENKLAELSRAAGDRYGMKVTYINETQSKLEYFVESNGVRRYYTPNRNGGIIESSNLVFCIMLYGYGTACISPRVSIKYRDDLVSMGFTSSGQSSGLFNHISEVLDDYKINTENNT